MRKGTLTAILALVLATAGLFSWGPELSAAPKPHDFREVEETSKPIYRARSGDAWKGFGRMVGQTKYQPVKFSLSFFRIVTSKAAQASSPASRSASLRASTPTVQGGDKTDLEVKPMKVEDFNGDISVYETSFLPPGRYRVFINADGFHEHAIQEVEIKKGFDCIIDIDFGTKVFYVGY